MIIHKRNLNYNKTLIKPHLTKQQLSDSLCKKRIHCPLFLHYSCS